MNNLVKVKLCKLIIIFLIALGYTICYKINVSACTEPHKVEYDILYNDEGYPLNPRNTLTDVESLGLQKIAIAEGWIDGPIQMAYIMQTVLNRVEDPRFPNTIEEVIAQENQFVTYENGDYEKAIPDTNSMLALELCFQLKNEGQLYFDMKQNKNT